MQGIAANVPGLVFRLERLPLSDELDFAYISEGSQRLVGYAPAVLSHRDVGIRSLVHPDDRNLLVYKTASPLYADNVAHAIPEARRFNGVWVAVPRTL